VGEKIMEDGRGEKRIKGEGHGEMRIKDGKEVWNFLFLPLG
jgi:hypothetical protein